ncbi:hypothetical protein HXA34_19660 [Salipaludibacillus agaradhaerens]|jgi:hypothetical protein|uniref:hypothetical protein n=1 Tax=Salipaludibacillus agaradhaerens TaxID=76935 RepID=UPI002150FF5E|nr:hypothetical protein [Salipaludibacillus agaradhaerens]MCR6108521.1 hypothetical protein [Salipaludibacillus agaradhaerens]MCR6120542.1 hypothetical protein [Salipaludibacillus agaradhaerens]
MAKIEEAYSLEYDDVIEVEKAYELFWDGQIADKRAFECPKCSLQITAANIDKVRVEMKNTPHFKAYGEHEFGCSYELEVLNERNTKNETKNNQQSYIGSQSDALFLERPKTHRYVRSNQYIKREENQNELLRKNKSKKESYQKKKKSNYYSIKPLISKFIRYKNENKTKEKYIEIKKFKISYEDMFNDLACTDLNNISNYKRIYYGGGNIVRSKKNKGDYIIFFEPGITNKHNKQTALYISAKIINESLTNKKWITELESLCEEETGVKFFAYCKISQTETGKYIYLSSLSNLDFFDFRI